ncbi:MAG: hypothetical protein GX950_00500 [Candidatus Diapherotrites archaeon]|uniref:Uncharacterized protein n=1 Tax=Candidatus Iainarchaeum sp. TaxID=3101447 RepID=A0A7K4BYR1_9ARCH|nr:hypothetical protein [Candidatus Diapherotrites archaeon]
MKIFDFFKPTWKKLQWFFLIFFIAQVYQYLIIGIIPYQLFANFVNFVLNPATIIMQSSSKISEPELLTPLAATVNALWHYFLATIMAKEISKDKE